MMTIAQPKIESSDERMPSKSHVPKKVYFSQCFSSFKGFFFPLKVEIKMKTKWCFSFFCMMRRWTKKKKKRKKVSIHPFAATHTLCSLLTFDMALLFLRHCYYLCIKFGLLKALFLFRFLRYKVDSGNPFDLFLFLLSL